MQSQPTRQQLQDQLEQLEFQQRILQRKIISTQVKLELLTQRENRQTFYNHNIRPQQTSTTNQDNASSTSSNDNNINSDNTEDSSKSESDNDDNNDDNNNTNEEEDSEEEAENPNHLLSDGLPISLGEPVRILNPANDEEEGDIIVGATPKRLQIKLQNGRIVLRQADNLQRP